MEMYPKTNKARRSILLIVCAMVLCIGALSACGGSPAQNESPASNVPPSDATPDQAAYYPDRDIDLYLCCMLSPSELKIALEENHYKEFTTKGGETGYESVNPTEHMRVVIRENEGERFILDHYALGDDPETTVDGGLDLAFELLPEELPPCKYLARFHTVVRGTQIDYIVGITTVSGDKEGLFVIIPEAMELVEDMSALNKTYGGGYTSDMTAREAAAKFVKGLHNDGVSLVEETGSITTEELLSE